MFVLASAEDKDARPGCLGHVGVLGGVFFLELLYALSSGVLAGSAGCAFCDPTTTAAKPGVVVLDPERR